MRKFFTSFYTIAFILIFAIIIQSQLFGDEFKYDGKDRRDPFIHLITGQKKISIGLEAVESIEDIKFEGIIFDPSGRSMAVLNGEIIKEGEKAYEVEIVKIYDTGITLKINNKVHTIGLIEEGGETVGR